MLLTNLVFGSVWMKLPADTDDIPVRVAIIQGNISSHDKWGESSEEKTRRIHENLTKKAASEGAELVLWAETVFPYVLNERGDLQRFVSNLAKECNVTLIVGALYTNEAGDMYNALFQVSPNGDISQRIYTKRHLVPFGEYVPMRSLLEVLIPPLAELSALGDDLTAGEDVVLFDTEDARIGALICFDSIYEELNRDSVTAGAQWMMVSTNDSWFRDSAAVYMHQSQSQLRAIESGRYFLRSANTGISSVISSKGEPLTAGYAVTEILPQENLTPYMLIGNLFVYLCMAFVGLLIPLGILTQRKRSRPFEMASRYGTGT